MKAINLYKEIFKENPKSSILKIIIFAAFLWFTVFFLIFPNLNTIVAVFWQDGAFTMRAPERLFGSALATNALRNSFILAPVLSVTVGIIGISLVLITEYFKIFGAKILRLGYMTTLLYWGIILVSGWRFLYAADGFITRLLAAWIPGFYIGWFEGFWAVLFVMTFAATGNHLIFLRNALRSVDFQTVEAAQNMGASSFTVVTKIILPVLIPSLIAVTMLTFVGGLTAMAAPLLIGGRDFQTINPRILSFSLMPGSRDLAALMALLLGIASMFLVGTLAWLEKRGHYLSTAKVKSEIVKQKIKNPIINVLFHIYAYVLFIIYVAPVVIITLFSFMEAGAIHRREFSFDSFTLNNYRVVFSNPNAYSPLIISTIYSLVAALAVAALVLVLCRIITKHKGKLSTFIEYAFMIPWLLPTVLIALGLVTTFSSPQWFMGNRVITGSMGIMVLGYVIIRIPFTLRLTRAAFYAIDDTLEEAAKNLGAKSYYTFFRIILPVILPSVLAIFALNFNFLLTEFDLSTFLYHPLARPMGVMIRRQTEDGAGGGTYGITDGTALTLVYAVLTMAVAAVVLYIAYGRSSKEFKE